MYGVLIFSYYKVLKLFNFQFLILKILKKKYIFNNLYFFFLKKNILFFLINNYKKNFLNFFLSKLLTFLKPFKVILKISGKRFKFFLNKDFFFFKMDTSKFLYLSLFKNFYFNKNKKQVKFFFFNKKIFQMIINIVKLKIPNKYTKKGISFN
jgi:hypothetical protein